MKRDEEVNYEEVWKHLEDIYYIALARPVHTNTITSGVNTLAFIGGAVLETHGTTKKK